MIGIIFSDGRVSNGIGETKKQATSMFKNYYGYRPPQDSYFSEVERKIETHGEMISMRWVERRITPR